MRRRHGENLNASYKVKETDLKKAIILYKYNSMSF